MGRHSRLIVPGVALHVRQRANAQQSCFRQDNDRLVYLSLLREHAAHRHCGVHVYCLMTNHVHLLVTPSDAEGCALLMRDLGRSYAAYFNRRYGRMGNLWEHPFRSCLVESREYILNCHRYIERNPVRAGMVDAPRAYCWSSYPGNGALRRDPLLTPHPEYLALGLNDISRQRAYAQLLEAAEDQAFLRTVREATEGGFPLVGDALKAQLVQAGARLEPGKPGPRATNRMTDEIGQLEILYEAGK
jgi:putative transposase